jgi:hypothetical protein
VIYKGAFADCPSVKKLVLPKGCKVHEVVSNQSGDAYQPIQNHERIIRQLINVYKNDEGYEELDSDKVVNALSHYLPHEEDEYYHF